VGGGADCGTLVESRSGEDETDAREDIDVVDGMDTSEGVMEGAECPGSGAV